MSEAVPPFADALWQDRVTALLEQAGDKALWQRRASALWLLNNLRARIAHPQDPPSPDEMARTWQDTVEDAGLAFDQYVPAAFVPVSPAAAAVPLAATTDPLATSEPVERPACPTPSAPSPSPDLLCLVPDPIP